MLLASFSAALSPPSLRKGTMVTAMGTHGCLTCQRSVNTSTVRLLPSHTRPVRTSSPLTSPLPTSLYPTRSLVTPITSGTLSTSTPYTSRHHQTNNSRGLGGKARRGSAATGGAGSRVRSWAWREALRG